MKRAVYLVLALAGCVADPSGTSSNSDSPNNPAYFAEYLNGFRSICLAKDLSDNRAQAAAVAIGIRLNLPSHRRPPTDGPPPSGITLDGNSWDESIGDFDPDLVYETYSCDVQFRGTWADEIYPKVQNMLSSAGFTSVARFSRESYAPELAHDGKEVIVIKGKVARGGKTFNVSITQSPPGTQNTSQARISYISSTQIFISSKPIPEFLKGLAVNP